MSEILLTGTFRVSFPNVFKPTKNSRDEDVYDLAMLFPKGSKAVDELMRIAKDAAKEKWPKLEKHPNAKSPKKWFPGLRCPLRDGADKAYDGYGEDIVFARASTKKRPPVVSQKNVPLDSTDDFYAGCYARAFVNAWCYDRDGNKGVAFGLSAIQKVRDGESFGGMDVPEFEEIETDDGAESFDNDADGADDGTDYLN